MPFTARTDWELKPNALSRQVEKFRREGQTILDLTESNPTRCGFAYPEKQILAALSNSRNISYAPSPHGMLRAREAVCRYYARKDIRVHPDQIFLTASTSEAYSFIFRLLAGYGEGILFPKPSYPLFDFLGRLNDVSVKHYPLIYDEGWRPDFEKYRSAINPKIRAVVMVNPNNPTGSFIHETDFSVLDALARQRHIPIISDEVFIDYVLDERTRVFPLLKHKENLIFVLGGLSKALGLPQMKLSWIVVQGPSKTVSRAVERLEVIADTYLSVSTPSQNALEEWMSLQTEMRGMILARVRKNFRLLTEALSPDRGGRVLKAEGGWYAVLELPKRLREEKFALTLLEQARVLVYPGYFFDFAREPYVVISLLPEEAVFREALSRILKKTEDDTR